MARSKPNQVRYNDKISAIRVEINREKERFVANIKDDIQRLLERRSPEDLGDLKKSWRVTVTNKHKLAGHSLSKLQQARPISVGVSIESTSRHAPMQMFGWKAVPGQLLTGFKKRGKWQILRASRPMFNGVSGSGESRRHRKRTLIRSFITNGGYHKPDPNLAFTDSSGHSIKSEIKRIVARRLKECKYLASAQFLSGDDVAQVWTANKTVSRIAKWMGGTLNTELNSRATATTFH